MSRMAWMMTGVGSWWAQAVGIVGLVFTAWHRLTAHGSGVAPIEVLAGLSLLVCLWAIGASLRSGGAFGERVLIVGTGPMTAKIIDEIGGEAGAWYRIIGVVGDAPEGRTPSGVALWLGPIERLDRIIGATRPTRIVMALADRRGPIPEQPLLNARMRGVAIEEAVRFYERATGKIAIEALTPRVLILSDGFRHSDFGRSDLSLALTRAVSLISAAAGLVVLAPLMAIIALAVRLESAGPVFFVHERVGRGGRSFGLIKFRTMREVDCQPSEWVCDNVHRITRVGAWLRRFRLDELPQFVNVLRGEMNLVGPRPHPRSNYQQFLDAIPYYALRESVRPGITGWAQVRYGYANTLDEETEKMRYDLYYIKHRSLWLDVRILLETAAVLVFDRRSHEAARRRSSFGGWHQGWHRTPTGATSR